MIDVATLCPGCMEQTGSGDVCPSCGYASGDERTPVALPERTVLNERFMVGRLLGKPGGFGITYLAFDLILETTAAIKEYMPQRLATRTPGATTIEPNSSEGAEFYDDGLDGFLEEARVLVQFTHPNIVRVRDFFPENNSAYLVMDYYAGMPLSEFLRQRQRTLDDEEAVALMAPILDGLDVVHARGYLHRDIKPSNIYITRDGSPILLDFGAARHALGEETESLSVILTPGYAPFEQYFRKGRQGPWTDVYSCAATMYYAMSGVRPPPALDRETEDELEPLNQVNPVVSAPVSAAIMQAMSRETDERPPSAAAFRFALEDALAGRTPPLPAPPHTTRRLRGLLASGLVALVLGLGAYALWQNAGPPDAEGGRAAGEPIRRDAAAPDGPMVEATAAPAPPAETQAALPAPPPAPPAVEVPPPGSPVTVPPRAGEPPHVWRGPPADGRDARPLPRANRPTPASVPRRAARAAWRPRTAPSAVAAS